MEKTFPNGFESWSETHHEVVSTITLIMNQEEYSIKLEKIQDEYGICGIWEFCISITDEFEELNRGREWDGEFFDEIEEFIRKKVDG